MLYYLHQVLLDYWLVCQQVHTKTTERISMIVGWRTGLGPEQTLFLFGADPD